MKEIKAPKIEEYITPSKLVKQDWFPFKSKDTVIKHVKQGKLPAIMLVGGKMVILMADARKYAKKKHKYFDKDRKKA